MKGDGYMKTTYCFWERVNDEVLGFILLVIGLLFLTLSLTFLPVFGLVIAIPILCLAIAFMMAKRSDTCRLLSESTKKILPKSNESINPASREE
jgi:hypothetical protein